MRQVYIFAQILLAIIMLSMGYNIIMIITEVFVSEPLGSWLY